MTYKINYKRKGEKTWTGCSTRSNKAEAESRFEALKAKGYICKKNW